MFRHISRYMIVFAVLLLLFSVHICVYGGEGKASGRTYALLVGLNYDNDPAMERHRLRYSVNDVNAMRELLVSYCGVRPEDIDVLTDEEKPTAPLIRNRLRRLAQKADEDDRVLLFYSGHGFSHDGAWAMVPYDFNADDINGTLLWNRDLTATLETSSAAEMIFISDSCYSGSDKSLPIMKAKNPLFGSKDARSGNVEFIELRLGGWGDLMTPPHDGSKSGGSRRPLVRLCSSGSGQVSREYGAAQLGAFTYAIDKLSRDWWKNTPRGSLTIAALHQIIIPEVEKTGFHTPRLIGDGESVVLMKKSPPESIAAPGSDDAGAALRLAVMAGNADLAERLSGSSEAVVSTDSVGWTALHDAVDAAMVERLLKKGARIDARSGAGYTPLHVAAMLNRSGAAAALLRHGADAKAADRWGRTPLHLALENGCAQAAETLSRNTGNE